MLHAYGPRTIDWPSYNHWPRPMTGWMIDGVAMEIAAQTHHTNWLLKRCVRPRFLTEQMDKDGGRIIRLWTPNDLPSNGFMMIKNKCNLQFPQLQFCRVLLKLNFSQYPSIHTNYIISHCTLYDIIIIIDTVLRQKRICKREK